MALQLDLCTDSDMARAFELLSTSFGHEHPFIEAVYPAHGTPSGRASGAERLLAMKTSDRNTTFVKVTDTSTGEMIGMAKWNIYKGVVPEETRQLSGNYWDSENAKELAEWNSNTYLLPRRRAIRESGGNLVSLDLMCVDPAHHFRGAGSMLMEWGVSIADKMGVEAVVESSVYGRRLYEKFGFIMQEHVTMEPPPKWAPKDAKGKQRFFWMKRPAKVIH